MQLKDSTMTSYRDSLAAAVFTEGYWAAPKIIKTHRPMPQNVEYKDGEEVSEKERRIRLQLPRLQ